MTETRTSEAKTPTDADATSQPTAAQKQTADHVWLHFTPTPPNPADIPIITRGEGSYVFDEQGHRYLDGLAGLFTVQVGHGRKELAEAASHQARDLAFFPQWGYGNKPAAELAERLSSLSPGDLNKVFFTNSGSESVETAWKLAKNYFRLIGKPEKHKVISRRTAYHGTTHGALSITGIPELKAPFEPLVPSTFRAPNTDIYRAREMGYLGDLSEPSAFGRWAADQVERVILEEGPQTVAAVFVEPVQNAGGCFPPPPGYFERLQEICTKHHVLLVSDEVICAYGRLGEYFGATRYHYQPDVITTAKGLTSGYSPMGAVLISDKIASAFTGTGETFLHGYTFGGHPVSAAVALANLDIFEREGLNQHVKDNEGAFLNTLAKLQDLNIVGEVRGAGYFYGIELVQDKASRETLTAEQCERVLKGFVSKDLFRNGLYCRADDRQDPVIQLSPPLIAGQEEFDAMEQILRNTLSQAEELL